MSITSPPCAAPVCRSSACATSTPSAPAAAAQKFGVPGFSSLADLRAAGANVIHVLTPPHVHAEVTLEALDLGCHVLVEKPLAEDPADCQAIAAARRPSAGCASA